MSTEHTVKSYDEELRRVHKAVLKMGGLCESQFAAAIQAVANRDPEVAAEIVREDAKIDEIEIDVDHLSVRLLALRQPMAVDLREIIAALKISAAIERIGDYAANVAKRAIVLAESRPVRPANGIPRMGRLVQRMIKDVLDAYTQKDAAKAKAVWLRDAEVDDLYSSLFREVLTYMMEDPRNITACTHLLFIAKNIERIGDHATNMAEMIHFLITGARLDGDRPKGDDSSIFPLPEAERARPGEDAGG